MKLSNRSELLSYTSYMEVEPQRSIFSSYKRHMVRVHIRHIPGRQMALVKLKNLNFYEIFFSWIYSMYLVCADTFVIFEHLKLFRVVLKLQNKRHGIVAQKLASVTQFEIWWDDHFSSRNLISHRNVHNFNFASALECAWCVHVLYGAYNLKIWAFAAPTPIRSCFYDKSALLLINSKSGKNDYFRKQ